MAHRPKNQGIPEAERLEWHGVGFMTMGERIQLARKRAGLSQEALGELTWIGTSSISDYERGKARPSAQALAVIAWVLNVSADFLLGITHEPRALEGRTPFVARPLTQEVAKQMGWTLEPRPHLHVVRVVDDLSPALT